MNNTLMLFDAHLRLILLSVKNWNIPVRMSRFWNYNRNMVWRRLEIKGCKDMGEKFKNCFDQMIYIAWM
jgi:hypothetical protein